MRRTSEVRPVVTGPHWMGTGIGSIETALVEIISGAVREVHILAYSVSDGAERLIDLLVERLRAGVRITFVVQRLDRQYHNVPSRLRALASAYPATFLLYDFTPDEQEALHAKCVVGDRNTALIGSANLSFNGLVRNHELGVCIEGPAAGELVSVIERLLDHPDAHRVIT
jgi:phosphatidylserine/phosphatidylglycerophosphate/cardiolipin synthase-like enzyme